MRHLIGVFLAVTASAAVLFGGGWGLAHLSAPAMHGTGLVSTQGGLALAAVLGTGAFLGVLLAVRAVSPLATGVPGLILLAWTVLTVINAHLATGWLPMPGLTVVAGFKALLGNGELALLATAMVVPLCMPSRWRRARGSEEDEDVLPTPTGLLT